MRIVIVGAGFTGIQLAKLLINEKNNVVVIDNDDEQMRHISNRLDCSVLVADGNNLETLEKAGIAKADALVCVTSSDEVNMITCSLVDAVYPDVLKIARVRNYAYYVNTAEAKKSHANAFSGKHRPLYGIDYMIHPDVEAAEAIVQAVENGAVSNVYSFGESEMQIFRITISEGSVFAGHKLMEIRNLTDEHLLISYIEKNGEGSIPNGNTILEPGNTIGVLASKNSISRILELCGSKQKELRKICIIGAGRIGTLVTSKIIEPKKLSLLKMISSKSVKSIKRTAQKLLIIDSDANNAKAAAEKFENAEVCLGDATDESFLREEGVPDFDLAICATHNHELNMVLAAYLESLGVKQTISLVTSSAFASIAEKLGVDVTVALRDVVVDSIMSHLRGNSVKEIHTVTNGDLEIIECVLPVNSPVSGKKIKELSEPGKFLVLLNKHGGTEDYEIVNGETSVHTGDHLVLIVQADYSQKILELFGNKED